ncbi:rab-GTPase-TBC domain-containing protein [Thamnocephalis sphaerospora]|uniref:Rab-GTPase-TBC domain-containing protein n=1 Tax=Thamnocephalis sphaerospora TaxID=78915 RepID=A0A4P9XR50_9FUNG|nr:rab-GTPase-TBC domain-containing protein [Thamnocephalis sphaerospora]|eukprot:RKP07790.1 rab-GTPase-TBC domain-containing protein [Thamnocephalis sphaerospora]
MAASEIEEFQEIMSAEVLVDMEKLRDLARLGVPDTVRGAVWRYLLGVERADRCRWTSLRSHEQSDSRNMEISKRVRGDVQRYQRRLAAVNAGYSLATRHDLTAIVERVLAAYLNRNKQIDYSPALVSLCIPFVFACERESDMYHCFAQLMRMLDDYLDEQSIRERVANFMTLFRALIPDLHNYFVEEEVDVNEWITSWLQYLLSKELPLPCLMRLWDMYFSLEGRLENHVYVCLALLRHYKDALEELEQSEIRTLLLRMPMLDINEVGGHRPGETADPHTHS